ncbi:MAG: hypothetical protein JSV65_08975, partial [Armatimonadota bacterium]
QIALYADLVARAAAYCDKAHPGVVKWIQVGNDLGFPTDNYCRLVAAVVAEVHNRELGINVVADVLQGRLARQLPSGKLPDIVGFHHLPGFARSGSKYPSQAEVILELRRALEGKRSYRGHPVEIWVDKWNPALQGENMRSFEVWSRVLDRLAEQQRLRVAGSGFITFCFDGRHTDANRAWALSWTDGVVSPGFEKIAEMVAGLCGKQSASGRSPTAQPGH